MNQDDIDQQNWDKGNTPPSDIGVDEINAYWKSRGVNDNVVRCFKDPYGPCLPDWVQTILVPQWKNLIEYLHIRSGDITNCYDFADGCRWLSNLVVAKNSGVIPLAFFYIAYNKVNLEEHAICGCMWSDTDRSLLVNFFEPQPTVVNSGFAIEVLKPVDLTDDEIASATDICY